MPFQYSCPNCGVQFTRVHRAIYCSRACANSAQAVKAEVRFWSKVDRSGDGCWMWTGATMRRGYGQFYQGPTANKGAHRFAFIVTFGPIPKGMCVCHRCDTPACVRPDHLFLGTARDNIRDMHAKGRHTYGEDHPNAKLTEAAVRIIRVEWADGVSAPRLGRRFGVSPGVVREVAERRAWVHVE